MEVVEPHCLASSLEDLQAGLSAFEIAQDEVHLHQIDEADHVGLGISELPVDLPGALIVATRIS